jgi:hypothetical protein
LIFLLMATNRKFRFFRVEDGRRIPRVMELDHNLTFIDEYDAGTPPKNPVQAPPPEAKAAPVTAGVHETPERQRAHLVARWSTRMVADNPIPGTDDMREMFFAEVEAVKKKYTEKYKECPPCVIGQIIRKYRAQLEESGLLADGQPQA